MHCAEELHVLCGGATCTVQVSHMHCVEEPHALFGGTTCTVRTLDSEHPHAHCGGATWTLHTFKIIWRYKIANNMPNGPLPLQSCQLENDTHTCINKLTIVLINHKHTMVSSTVLYYGVGALVWDYPLRRRLDCRFSARGWDKNAYGESSMQD